MLLGPFYLEVELFVTRNDIVDDIVDVSSSTMAFNVAKIASHRCQHGLRKMRESARNDISRTHANFVRAHKCEQNTAYDIHTRYHTL